MNQEVLKSAVQMMMRQYRSPLSAEYTILSAVVKEFERAERLRVVAEHAYSSGDLDILELALDPSVVLEVQAAAADREAERAREALDASEDYEDFLGEEIPGWLMEVFGGRKDDCGEPPNENALSEGREVLGDLADHLWKNLPADIGYRMAGTSYYDVEVAINADHGGVGFVRLEFEACDDGQLELALNREQFENFVIGLLFAYGILRNSNEEVSHSE